MLDELAGRPAYGCGWMLALLESAKVIAPDREFYPAVALTPACYLEPLLMRSEAKQIDLQLALLREEIGGVLPQTLLPSEQADFFQGYFKHRGKIEVGVRVTNEDHEVLSGGVPRNVSPVLCRRAMQLPPSRFQGVRYVLDDAHSKTLRVQVDSVVESVALARSLELHTLLRAAAHEETILRSGQAWVYYIKFDSLWQNSPDWYAGPFTTPELAESALQQAIHHAQGMLMMDTTVERSGVDIRNALRVYGIMSREEALEDGMRESGQRGYNIVPSLPLSRDELVAWLSGGRIDEKI